MKILVACFVLVFVISVSYACPCSRCTCPLKNYRLPSLGLKHKFFCNDGYSDCGRHGGGGCGCCGGWGGDDGYSGCSNYRIQKPKLLFNERHCDTPCGGRCNHGPTCPPWWG